MKSIISGLGLRSSFPKTNLHSVREILLHVHAPIYAGSTKEVACFNLPYMANKNLREMGRTG